MKYIGLFDEKEDIVTKENLETKQDIITGAATTITDDDLTVSRALVSDASGKVAVSPVTSTELGYLDGVTSNVQTQLDSKAIDADVVHKTGDESISGEKTFIAPKNISGTEQTTTKFETSNGGAVIVGKEGANNGTMLRFDQVDGTPRLKFRASTAAGAMIWEQPEHGAQLYIDLGDHGTGGDYHRISFPSGYGVLALQSDVNDKVPKSRKINGYALSANIDLTASDVGALPDTTTIPTKTSQLDNDSGFITSAPVTSVNTKTGAVTLSASDVGAQPTITVNGIIKGDGAGNLSAQDTVTAELVDLPTVPTKVSELENDANYITAAQAPVQSVNNKTGAVSLTASDVSAIPSTLTGTAGQVLTKTADGQEWKDAPVDESNVLLKNVGVTMPSVAYWQSVVYGNGKFVAIAYASNIVAYSTDGINWTQSTLSNIANNLNWRSVTYGNGKFVAIAYGSIAVAYSSDGINWTRSNTLSINQYWQSITYGDGKFVAIAYRTDIAVYSSDGINWTQSTLPSSMLLQSIAYGNGKFVAVPDNSSTAVYSSDGINWTQSTLPASNSWKSVCYGNGKFVAVTDGSNIAAYSTDGINWTQSTLSNSARWLSVIYGDGKFVTVAFNSDVAEYSTDGITWQSSVDQLQYPDGTDIHDRVREVLDIPEPESEVFICAVSGNDTRGYTCDKTYAEILEAYNAGKVCIAKYVESSVWTYICYLVDFYSVQQLRHFTFGNIVDTKTTSSNSRSIRITINIANAVSVTEYAVAEVPQATKITLTVAGWDSTAKTQSVTVTGVSSNATKQEIRVMPVNAALDSPYIAAGVQCVAQAANSLTFACETIPTEAIEVYVVIQGVNYSA